MLIPSLTGILDRFLYMIGIFAIAILVLEIGFYVTVEQAEMLRVLAQALVIGFAVQEVVRLWHTRSIKKYFSQRWFEALVAVLAVLFLNFSDLVTETIRLWHPTATITDITLIYLGLSQTAVLVTQIIGALRGSSLLSRMALRPPQLFLLSFTVPILLGTLLLMMPKATHVPISFVDALFTATSAVCVTGLIVVDTATVFTGLGQAIICLLFQIGGLGIMTLTIFFATLFTRSIGVRERILMSNFLSEENIGEVRFLLAKIGAFTFTIELVGAVLLYWAAGYSFASLDVQGVYSSVFHAVSAFCNAGFSIFTDGLADPAARATYAYSSVIMVLITLGGLGFPVLSNMADILRNRFSRQRRQKVLTTSSRLVLSTSFMLVTVGTVLIWATESRFSLSTLGMGDQFFHSLFLSVTSRTAGFNIMPMGTLSVATMIIIMGLMFIGASPMSTGGGVKNVTLALAFLNFRSQVLGVPRIEIFGREIDQQSVNRAFGVLAVSMFTLMFSWFVLVLIEPGMNVLDLGFEVISAFATVGLSRGLTPEFSPASKILLSVLMLTGRVGAVTVLASFFAPPRTHNYHFLKDNVTIY